MFHHRVACRANGHPWQDQCRHLVACVDGAAADVDGACQWRLDVAVVAACRCRLLVVAGGVDAQAWAGVGRCQWLRVDVGCPAEAEALLHQGPEWHLLLEGAELGSGVRRQSRRQNL